MSRRRVPVGRLAVAAAALLACVVPVSDAVARKLDLRIAVSATQTTEQTWTTDCLADGPPVKGSRTERLTVRAGTPGRWFLYAPHKGGLRRGGAPISAGGTAVRDSTVGRNGLPSGCGQDAPESCGERTVRFELTPALLERPGGRERGLAVDSTLTSSADPYPDCGGGSLSLLDPPASDLFGGTSPLGSSTAPPRDRYVYAPLPSALRNGCGRRRFVTHGHGHDVTTDVGARTETELSFTITVTRVGCLGR